MNRVPLNLALCSRVLSAPWAMRRETLASFTRALLMGEPEQNGRQQADTTWDGWYWDKGAQEYRRGKIPTLPGYTVLNYEGLSATLRGTMPKIPPGTHCILVWGALGRGWSETERYWFDGIEVDEIVSAIEARPPGEKIVLWFRSPGGFVTGVPEAAAQLRVLASQRKITAFTDSICASAAYWLAAQCPRIVATPTAEVGSIGVYLALYDFSAYLQKMGINLELFRAGELKGIWVMGNPVDDQAREHLQAGVDESYRRFTAAVTEMRAIAEEHMQGQTLSGDEAQAAVLTDTQVLSAASFFAAA